MGKGRGVLKFLLFFCVIFTVLTFADMPCAAAQTANGMPDINLPCSIEVDFSASKNCPPDGTEVAVYRIAYCEYENTHIKEKYTNKFSKLSIPVALAADESHINTLKEYIVKNNITSAYSVRTEKSKAILSGIPCGVYLVTYPPGDNADVIFSPFIIKLPILSADSGEYVYNAVSVPKTQTRQPAAPVRNDKDKKLPQTGQLWWPAKVFALLCVIFTAAAYFIRKTP